VHSDYNQKHKHRFVVLYDKTFDLNEPSNIVVGGGIKKHIKYTHTFKNPLKTVLYNAAGTGIAGIEKTALYLKLVCGANCSFENMTTSITYLDA